MKKLFWLLLFSVGILNAQLIDPYSHQTLTETTVTSVIATGTDDAEEDTATNTPDLGSSDLEFNADSGNQSWVGIRFTTNLNIPAGATITEAYITFQCNQSQSSSDVDVDIHGEVSDTGTFSGAIANVSGRTLTTAWEDWDDIESWTIDLYYQTPDFASVVQEIVNDGGYTQGDAIVILFEPTAASTNRRIAASQNHTTRDAPELTVKYLE